MTVDTVNWIDNALCEVTGVKVADFAVGQGMPAIQTRKGCEDF